MTAHSGVGRISAGLVILLAASLAVGACNTAPAEGPPPRTAADAPADRPAAEGTAPDAPDGSAGATTLAGDVFFPTLAPRSADVPDSLGHGKLIVDGGGCLRLRSGRTPPATPLWPPGFELRAGEGGIRVLDGRGRLRAKVGEEVRLGGGYVNGSIIEDNGISLEGKTSQELLERCPGSYFITQEDGTRILG